MDARPKRAKRPQTPEQREVVVEIKKLEKEKEAELKQIRYLAGLKRKIEWLNRFQKDSYDRHHERVREIDAEIQALWSKWRQLGASAK